VKPVFALLGRLWEAETFSPTAFVIRALVMTVLFCISELLGLREYTTFLSGTSANVNLSWSVTSALGLIHLLLYVGFILLAPVSLLAAGLIVAWNYWKAQTDVDAQVETISTGEPR
jgi:hypothetical protein